MEWRAEQALIARPNADVVVRVLPPGGYAFALKMRDGATLIETKCNSTAFRARLMVIQSRSSPLSPIMKRDDEEFKQSGRRRLCQAFKPNSALA